MNTPVIQISNNKLRSLKLVHQTDSLSVLDAVEQFLPVETYRKLYKVGAQPQDSVALTVRDLDQVRNALNEMGAALMHAMPYMPRQFSTGRERVAANIGG